MKYVLALILLCSITVFAQNGITPDAAWSAKYSNYLVKTNQLSAIYGQSGIEQLQQEIAKRKQEHGIDKLEMELATIIAELNRDMAKKCEEAKIPVCGYDAAKNAFIVPAAAPATSKKE